MRSGDIVPASLLLVLSAAVFFETRDLEFFDGIPGPAFLPLWLAIAGIVLFVLRLLEARRQPAGGIDWPGRDGLQRVILTFAGLAVIPPVATAIGMLAAIVLFMVYLLVVVLRQRVRPSVATVAITAGAVYGIFVLWLGIALPRGPLGF